MSRVDDVIARYAPGGIEFYELGALAELARVRVDAAELDETNYVGVDNLLPDFGGRRDSGYGANSSGAIKFSVGDILVGNIRPYLRKVWLADRDGGASPDVLTIALTSDGRGLISPRFLYYLLASDPFIEYSMQHAKGAKMPRGDKAATLRYRVPVPPLEVQREIVRVLDYFTELEAGLQVALSAESAARLEQHARYRATVLAEALESPVRRLEEIASYTNGKAHERLVDPDGDVALMTARFISRGGLADRFIRGQDVLTPALPGDTAMVLSDLPNGRALARTFLVETAGKYAANQRVCLLRSRDAEVLDPEYFSRFMDRCPELLAYNNGIDQTHLSKGAVLKVGVPVPPVQVQRRIAATLQALDRVFEGLASAIGSEQVARRQQYAYYRDKLLSFEERAA